MKSSPTEIAQRYVNALFSLALESNAVAAIEKDLNELASSAAAPGPFLQFVHNPLLSREQQTALISVMADKFGANPLTKKFLVTLATANRLTIIDEIAKQFAAKAQAERGEVSAEVTSAAAMDKAQQEAVGAQLSSAIGKKMNITYSVDASLLGGIVVKIGSQQLDASLAGKLNRLNIALKAA